MKLAKLVNRNSSFCLLLFASISNSPTQASIINVTTNDSYTKIEAAQAGDQVVIAAGTYAFRVYLTHQGTTANPIIIRAQDPAHPPTWDFGGTLVENAPGSYTAGDRGRGGWQFSGAQNYYISGIVFRHCRTATFNSAGIRYYNGSTNLCVKDCQFVENDNGLTGGTQDSEAVVEFCEFNANGNTNASFSAPTHNIYVYGGTLSLRYCYIHDSVQGENFHIRCRNSTLECNWFARANNYEGDLMTDDDFNGTGPFTQTMVLRGNVFVQKTLPGNHSQVVALFNDAGLTNLTLRLRMLYNTFVGANTNSALVHVSNADNTQMSAEISDNIIYGTKTAVLVEKVAAATVMGLNNWLQTNAAAGALSNSVRSEIPGFRNPVAQDYTLLSTSSCIGAAGGPVFGQPGEEYFANERTNREWRTRSAARDLGAFESTSAAAPIGPYDPFPEPSLTLATGETVVQLQWPLFAQDFSLDRSTNLSAPIKWTSPAVVFATNFTGVTAALPFGPATFFRLRK